MDWDVYELNDGESFIEFLERNKIEGTDIRIKPIPDKWHTEELPPLYKDVLVQHEDGNLGIGYTVMTGQRVAWQMGFEDADSWAYLED